MRASIYKHKWLGKTITLSAATAAIFLCLLTIIGLHNTVVAAEQDDVVITEFMADPVIVTDSKGEWLEIQNTTNEPIILDSWDVDGSTIQPSISLEPDQKAVICRNSDSAVNGGVICDGQASGMSFTNSGDRINLRDETNTVINSVDYSADTVKAGHSTIVGAEGLQIDMQNSYSSNNFGTPSNNDILPKTSEIAVTAVIDRNANGEPDWGNANELHQAGWQARLYRDIGASNWSYLGELTTTRFGFIGYGAFDVIPGEYYVCLVNKSGYEFSFARTITSFTTFPDNSVENDSAQEDESARCTRTDNTTVDHTSLVFGSTEE
jgi:hypothetical protein